MTLAALYFLGGQVIRGFAFVMLIGIIVGTYSSIYIASPFALLWEQVFGVKGQERRTGGATRKDGTGAESPEPRPSRLDRPRSASDADRRRERERRVKV